MALNFKRKWVFLDTEAFVAECFNFTSKRMSEILRLAKEGSIQVVTTTVTVKESKRRIEKMIRAARNHLKGREVRFTLGILRQTKLECSFLNELNVELLSKQIEEQLDRFLTDCK